MRAWVGMVVWAVGVGVAGCGSSAPTDTPVEITAENLRGYWYGSRVFDDPLAASYPPAGPFFLHLGGALPGVGGEGIDAVAEWVGLAPFSLGRHRLDGDRLMLEALVPAGWNQARNYRIASLTRETMVLEAETQPPERYTLQRGDTCAAGGGWWPLEPNLLAGDFGPDGRLHLLQDRVYGFTVPGLCYPFERAEIQASKVSVGADDVVMLGRVDGQAIEIQRFPAITDPTAPLEPTVERIEHAAIADSWLFDHLRLAHAGAVPVVLYTRSATVYAWHREGGAWLGDELPLPFTDLLTPTDLEVVSTPIGASGLAEVWLRRRGAPSAHVFDGSTWRVEDLPAHPELGVPTVLGFDARGGLHGAWVVMNRALAVWDPLVVGRYRDGAWTTAYAGFGSPWGLRVNDDGSYDVLTAIARQSGSVGHVHVEALAPGRWTTHYGPDRFLISALLATTYNLESVGVELFMQPWAAFSPDGALLAGGGGEPPTRRGFGLWKNPRLEEAERTRDRRLIIDVVGPEAATVEIPAWDVSCSARCEVFVASQSIVPLQVTSEGLVTLTTSTPQSIGLSQVDRLPDGTWAAVFEPDLVGAVPFDVTLTVTATARSVAAVAVVDAAAEGSLPRLAAARGETAALVRRVGESGVDRLETFGPDGARLATAPELGAIRALGATREGFAVVTADEQVQLSAALAVTGRTAFAAPARPFGLALGPDGVAVTAERLDDGLTTRLTTHGASPQSVDVALPKVGTVVAAATSGTTGASDLIAVGFDTDSYERTAGATLVPGHHLAVAAFDAAGAPRWTLALPKDSFRQARLAASDTDVVWVVTQYRPKTWPAGSPFAALPPMTGPALTHVFRLGADGIVAIVSSEAVPVSQDVSLAAAARGVWLGAGSDAHLNVTWIPWVLGDGEGAVMNRSYSARRPGECTQTQCPDEPVVLAALGAGDLAVFHHQRGRALSFEGTELPAVEPPLAGKTAYVRITAK
ncbi:MAG: hypothetical protein JNJ59_00105 [Deltaproteobacteria bacterium]|nr:hypothetical protein [Deltaproteobacteria bacterium]